MSRAFPKLVLLAAAAACGDGQRGRLEPDGGADAAPDAASDGAPDSEPDGGARCGPPSETVVVRETDGPARLGSLTLLPAGQYLLSAAVVRSGVEGVEVTVASGSSLDALAVADLPYESLALGYDRRTGELVGLAARGDERLFLRVVVGTGWVFDVAEEVSLCTSCGGTVRPPLAGPSAAAVAAESLETGEVLLWVVPYDGGPPSPTAPVSVGSRPTVVGGTFGPVVVYESGDRLALRPAHWDGAVSGPEELVTGVGLAGFGALALEGSRILLAAAMDDARGPGLDLHLVDAEGALTAAARVEDSIATAVDLSISTDDETLLVAWAESFGEGRVGAHFAALDAEGRELLLGPTLVGPPATTPSAPSGLRALAAPHPRGHVVFWNDEEEGGGQALRAAVIPCAAGR